VNRLRSAVVLVLGLALAVGVGQSGSGLPSQVWVPTAGTDVLVRGIQARPVLPTEPAVAAARARALIQAARRQGNDPRLLGHAQAVLAPWWGQPAPPPDVRLMRATLRQSEHDFVGALVDLEALTRETPDDPQVWLTLATVLSTVARPVEAIDACRQLKPYATEVALVVCEATPRALTGDLPQAIDTLKSVLALARGHEQSWALSVLGELLVWNNQVDEAMSVLRQSLQLDSTDDYTRGLLADVLLDAQDLTAALAVVEGHRQNDALLLREVLATRLGKNDGARVLFAERIAAQRQRGDVLHVREAAWYALLVEGDTERALRLALDNFRQQRSPADARLLFEAALAANDAKAARSAEQWLGETRLPWRALRLPAAKLGARQ
jgi:hypothetical protein